MTSNRDELLRQRKLCYDSGYRTFTEWMKEHKTLDTEAEHARWIESGKWLASGLDLCQVCEGKGCFACHNDGFVSNLGLSHGEDSTTGKPFQEESRPYSPLLENTDFPEDYYMRTKDDDE